MSSTASSLDLEIKVSAFNFCERTKIKIKNQITEAYATWLLFTEQKRKKDQVFTEPYTWTCLLTSLRRIIVTTLTSNDCNSNAEFLLYRNSLKKYTQILDKTTEKKKRLQQGVLMPVSAIFFHAELGFLLLSPSIFPNFYGNNEWCFLDDGKSLCC